jgi:polyhydroxyalkanoate synthesis regulator phasin
MNSQDLQQLDELLQKRLKEGLKDLATKNDLKNMKKDLEGYILDVFTSADNRKAEKTEVDKLKEKINKLEDKVFPN